MIAGLRRGQENSPFSELEKLCTVGWVDGGGDKWDRLRVRTPILNGGQTQWGEFLFGELLIFTKGEFGTGYKRLLHCLQKFCHPYLHWYFDTLWELLSSHFFVVVLLLNGKILGGNEWIFIYQGWIPLLSPYCVLPMLYQTFISWIYEIQRNISWDRACLQWNQECSLEWFKTPGTNLNHPNAPWQMIWTCCDIHFFRYIR